MKVCSKCGLEKAGEEFYKGHAKCKACTIAYGKEYYASHRKERIAYAEKWNAINHDKVSVRKKAYRQKNKTRRMKYIKGWSAANKDKRNASKQNRRSKEHNIHGKHTAKDINFLLEIQDNKCLSCKKAFSTNGKNKFHIDHIVAIANEHLTAYNSLDNLQILCPSCNLSKHKKIIDYRSKAMKKKISNFIQQPLF